jgi:FkbM family methyltransferase
MRDHMSDLKRYETRDGPMLGFASDVYISRSLELYGEYCPSEREMLVQLLKPGRVAVEIGANIGSHTVALARACAPGVVHAFEPQQRVFQALCANLALNDVTNVVAYPHACGSSQGWAVVPSVNYSQHTNPGCVSLLPDGQQGQRTQVVALDDLELPACHLIKIDVEGFEPEVLRGAARTIERCRPVLYVENDRAANQQTVFDLISSHRYKMYWHTPKLFDPENFRGHLENVFPGILSMNVLAIPDERSSNLPNKPIDPRNWTSPVRARN